MKETAIDKTLQLKQEIWMLEQNALKDNELELIKEAE